MTPGKGSKEHYFTFTETESRKSYHKSYLASIFPNSSYHWQEVCCTGDGTGLEFGVCCWPSNETRVANRWAPRYLMSFIKKSFINKKCPQRGWVPRACGHDLVRDRAAEETWKGENCLHVRPCTSPEGARVLQKNNAPHSTLERGVWTPAFSLDSSAKTPTTIWGRIRTRLEAE